VRIITAYVDSTIEFAAMTIGVTVHNVRSYLPEISGKLNFQLALIQSVCVFR